MERGGKADETNCTVEKIGLNGRRITFRFWWD
jgi:hypothetical protein